MSISEAQKKASKKYRQSDKGKVTIKRYRQSERGRVTFLRADKKYKQSDKGKAARICYKQSDRGKDYRLKNLYNLSLEDYSRLFIQQEGKCKICSKEFNTANPRDICIDHDHETDKVRGLLCRDCNFMLGFSHESMHVLVNAISYLVDSNSYSILSKP